jgi:hypothetical protein
MLLDDLPATGEMDNLAPPLIPSVEDNIDLIGDIYCVGESPGKRWRMFIDCKDWNPRQFHEKLLVKRAYNARMCWETSYYLGLGESNWLSRETISLIQRTAHFKLRVAEFEILTFQLTCGMLGIKCEDHDKLFTCSVLVFTTMVWFSKNVLDLGDNKDKERRTAHIELMQDLRPFSVDSNKRLAILIDKSIFTIVQFLTTHEGVFPLNSNLVEEMAKKMKNCILMLDDVIHVVE